MITLTGSETSLVIWRFCTTTFFDKLDLRVDWSAVTGALPLSWMAKNFFSSSMLWYIKDFFTLYRCSRSLVWDSTPSFISDFKCLKASTHVCFSSECCRSLFRMLSRRYSSCSSFHSISVIKAGMLAGWRLHKVTKLSVNVEKVWDRIVKKRKREIERIREGGIG